MEILTKCPVCNRDFFLEFLIAEDYFLTKERFTIVQCQNCELKFINPRPDETEISRYYESQEYISHDTLSSNFRNYLYSRIRNYTLWRKRKLIEMSTKGRKILDIGCGTGEFLSYCKKNGWTAQGFEPNSKPRDYAVRKHQISVLNQSEYNRLNTPEFDVVTLWHVLEHVHNLGDYFSKIRQILRENGILIIAVPNSNSWDAKKYKNFWAAYDLPRHLYHFSRDTLKLLAENNGFELMKILPMKLDAFYISLLSEKYSKKRTNYLRALFNGIRSNQFACKNNKEYSSLIFVLKAKKGQNKPF